MSAAATQYALRTRTDSPRSGIRLSFPSVDHCLGPSDQRFFGSGYREARYTVRGAVLEPSARGHRLRARAGVRHRGGFPAKATGARHPHLTTLDCLLLAVRAAEFCVAHQHGLDQRSRLRSWPRRFDVRAGSAPVEDGLADLPLEARIEHALRPARPGAPAVSRVEFRLAAMRATVEMVHELDPHPAGRGRAPVFGPVDDDLLSGRHPSAYGHNFAQQWQSILDLTVDLSTETAAASVVFGDDTARRPLAGALSIPAPRDPAHPDLRVPDPARALDRSASMLDGFVVALQLGQALLYEADGLARTDSDTMWMRTATITSAHPGLIGRREPGPTGPLSTTAQLLQSKVVPFRGGSWRTAVVTGALGGVQTRCAVAHRLPDASE